MDAYRTDGMEHAVLDVDTESPTGGRGLYESVGFEPTHGSVMSDSTRNDTRCGWPSTPIPGGCDRPTS